jgi:hypothetical protein
MESNDNKETKDRKPPAPYISWRTFTAFLDHVHEKVPAKVDASVLRNLSGTTRSQLLSALRFLLLIEPDGTVRKDLRELLNAHKTDVWKSDLGSFISAAYAPIVGNMNIEEATENMLRERFRKEGGVEGTTIDNAMRFYLAALKDAGIPYSPHLKIRQRAPRGGRGRRTKPPMSTGGEASDSQGLEAPEGTFEIPLDVIGQQGSIFVSDEITEEQWEKISLYVKAVLELRAR